MNIFLTITLKILYYDYIVRLLIIVKRNGFTLIEVLAIIVLLALVALIATPIIICVFTSSAKKAILIAGNSYKKAIETSMTSSSGSVKTSGNFVVKDGNL